MDFSAGWSQPKPGGPDKGHLDITRRFVIVFSHGAKRRFNST
jgi:hypothetical protein